MQFDSEGTKKTYSRPTLKKLTLEQAKQFLMDRTNCGDQEAEDAVERLCQERDARPLKV